MAPHQERVVTEKAELDDKRAKLDIFLGTKFFAGLDIAERERLHRQADIMSAYSDVLGERIAAF
jgi:hypothetical protein